MRSLVYLLVLLISASAQATQTAPRLIASVERGGDQLQLVLTNASETIAFQGRASISFDADAPVQFPLTLAPGATRRLPIVDLKLTVKHYELSLYNQAGALVLHHSAPLTNVVSNTSEATTGTTKLAAANKVKVTARIPRSLADRESEIPAADEAELLLLTFVLEPATPIKEASFTLKGRDFERREPVILTGRAELAFKLPAASNERLFSYSLTSKDGGLLAKGEVDLDHLAAPDVVTVSELSFDRTVYAPGEAARASFELEGNAPRGYRLEVTVQGNDGTSFFKDERKGSSSAGKSRQEFLVELPREMKGPITLTFRVFGGQTGLLFDSGLREIILSEAPPAKTNESKRLAP